MKTIKDFVSDADMDLEAFMLAQISPEEALKLLDFMRGHMPSAKTLNPAMSREESNEMSELFDKLRGVLVCRSMSNIEVSHAN